MSFPPSSIMTKEKQLITDFKINLIFPCSFHYLFFRINDFWWEKRFLGYLGRDSDSTSCQLFSLWTGVWDREQLPLGVVETGRRWGDSAPERSVCHGLEFKDLVFKQFLLFMTRVRTNIKRKSLFFFSAIKASTCHFKKCYFSLFLNDLFSS